MLQTLINFGPVIKIVVGILLLFSIISWTIIFYKALQLRIAKSKSKNFLEIFWKNKELDSINTVAGTFAGSPYSILFQEAYKEMNHFIQTEGENKLDGIEMENIARTLKKNGSEQIARFEKDLPFLATTGSATPFIGLFGTVWGIMTAFNSIGEAGSTSLAVVSPGIAEALITTAIGLAVAIPAVIAYNYFQNKIKIFMGEMNNFSNDLLNIIQRNLNKRK